MFHQIDFFPYFCIGYLNEHMATFTFEVKKAPNRFGRYQIFLRITENRKHERVKMAISVARVSDFNPKAKNNRWIRQTEPNYKQWNEDLALELEKAGKALCA